MERNKMEKNNTTIKEELEKINTKLKELERSQTNMIITIYTIECNIRNLNELLTTYFKETGKWTDIMHAEETNTTKKTEKHNE